MTSPVNTRCIYYKLGSSRSDPDNLTMCPILDFANHTNSSKHMSLVHTEAHHAPVPGKRNRSLSFISLRDGLEEGEEIFLYYGAHSNTTLFIEYAFVNKLPDEPASAEDFNGEVDIADKVEVLFQRRGTVGMRMKTILEDKGYWGWAFSFGYRLAWQWPTSPHQWLDTPHVLQLWLPFFPSYHSSETLQPTRSFARQIPSLLGRHTHGAPRCSIRRQRHPLEKDITRHLSWTHPKSSDGNINLGYFCRWWRKPFLGALGQKQHPSPLEGGGPRSSLCCG